MDNECNQPMVWGNFFLNSHAVVAEMFLKQKMSSNITISVVVDVLVGVNIWNINGES